MLATGARAAAAAAAAAAAHTPPPQAERPADTPADAGCLHRRAGVLQRRDCGVGRTGVHTGLQVRPIYNLFSLFFFIFALYPPTRAFPFVSRSCDKRILNSSLKTLTPRRNVRLQALTLDEVCTSLSILDDVGIVKVEGRKDMLKRTVRARR